MNSIDYDIEQSVDLSNWGKNALFFLFVVHAVHHAITQFTVIIKIAVRVYYLFEALCVAIPNKNVAMGPYLRSKCCNDDAIHFYRIPYNLVVFIEIYSFSKLLIIIFLEKKNANE